MAMLEAERTDILAKVSRMREQLPMIKARERSVDPDRLLAELQMMTGELLAEPKVDAELEALKRRAAAEAGKEAIQ
jgi:hypothetical protein